MPDATAETRRDSDVRAILTLLWAGSFVSAASLRVADPLLPEFSREFSVSAGDASIVVTSFALAYGISQIFYGPLGDRFGKIRVIAVAMVAAAIGIAGSAAAPDLASLSLMRLVGGAGAAAIVPLAMAYIGDVITYDRRQAVLARFLTGFVLGTAFGQACGGWFADNLGWRGLFFGFGLLFLGVDLLLWRAIAGGRVAETRGAGMRFGDLVARYAALLRMREARIVLATVGLEAFFYYGALAFIGAYLHYAFALELTLVGFVLAGSAAGSLLYAALVKVFVRRLGERRMPIAGGILLALCFAVLILAPDWRLVPPAVVGFGLGFFLLHNTLQVRATQMAPELRALSVSLFASLLYLGMALGVALAGIAVDRVGYTPLFATAGVGLLLLALGFSHSLRK